MKFLLFLLSCLAFAPLPAQEVAPIPAGPATVISTTGLSIREKPTTDSKRLLTAPCNARVEILPQENPRFDSLSPLRYRINDTPNEQIVVRRLGHWAKVQYKGRTGYMLDIFLASDEAYIRETVGLEGIDKDYRLLVPGANCRHNFHYDPQFHWYGLYRRPGAASASLKEVKVSQFVQRDEFFTNYAVADDMKDLVAIIGTRAEMEPRSLGKVPQQAFFYSMMYSGEAYEDGSREVIEGNGFSLRKKEDEHMQRLVLGGVNGQVLNPGGSELYMPNTLLHAGDLDGDGKKDFLISFGEKTGRTVLFLSSAARKGERVRAVAVYYSGYCC